VVGLEVLNAVLPALLTSVLWCAGVKLYLAKGRDEFVHAVASCEKLHMYIRLSRLVNRMCEEHNAPRDRDIL
jgi:hypothetical protein